MNPREYEIMYQLEDEHWWYVALHRRILSTLTHLFDNRGGDPWQILDAGCGTGAIARRLRQFGQVSAIDISNLALHFSKRRDLDGNLGQASVTALPLVADTFDLVVSMDVICSVPDDQRALAEFYRVLKPGGILMMNLPALEWLKGQHDLAVNIVHRYTPKQLKKQLAQQGFEIKKMSFANSLLFPLVAPYRLATNWFSTDNDDPRSDVFLPSRPINSALAWIMQLESRLISHFSLPIGMSLFVVARKFGENG
jgi:ubiquinone/menaquinone biosynthesis C-methylase UbiE